MVRGQESPQPSLPCSMSASQSRATGGLLRAVLWPREQGLGSICQTERGQ